MSSTTLTERAGMGAIPHEGGVAFRVWAPHANCVFVMGAFNNWTESHPMQRGDNGTWYADVPEAKISDEYRYLIYTGEQRLSRIDPYAREVTSSVGNGIVHDPQFDWEDDRYQLPAWPELVLYEMHIGTFNGPLGGAPGTYATAVEKFDHLKRLGVNVIEVMPTAEFAGGVSWGYNPAYAFAVESFGAQWDANFVHPIRKAVIGAVDESRSLASVRDAITFSYNGDAFQRVIYSESHDEVANGKSRVPSEISEADPENFFAQKRSTLAAGLVFTTPGIPMLFQGQEFLEGGWFQDTVPLDWHLSDQFRGILRLYRDLVQLRRNSADLSRGLCGRGVKAYHVNEETKLLAFHRWDKGGPGDDVVVVANFENKPRRSYEIGFPQPGLWRLRLNSDWKGYSKDFSDFASRDVTATPEDYDGCPAQGRVDIGPYSILIFSQDLPPAV